MEANEKTTEENRKNRFLAQILFLICSIALAGICFVFVGVMESFISIRNQIRLILWSWVAAGFVPLTYAITFRLPPDKIIKLAAISFAFLLSVYLSVYVQFFILATNETYINGMFLTFLGLFVAGVLLGIMPGIVTKKHLVSKIFYALFAPAVFWGMVFLPTGLATLLRDLTHAESWLIFAPVISTITLFILVLWQFDFWRPVTTQSYYRQAFFTLLAFLFVSALLVESFVHMSYPGSIKAASLPKNTVRESLDLKEQTLGLHLTSKTKIITHGPFVYCTNEEFIPTKGNSGYSKKYMLEFVLSKNGLKFKQKISLANVDGQVVAVDPSYIVAWGHEKSRKQAKGLFYLKRQAGKTSTMAGILMWPTEFFDGAIERGAIAGKYLVVFERLYKQNLNRNHNARWTLFNLETALKIGFKDVTFTQCPPAIAIHDDKLFLTNQWQMMVYDLKKLEKNWDYKEDKVRAFKIINYGQHGYSQPGEILHINKFDHLFLSVTPDGKYYLISGNGKYGNGTIVYEKKTSHFSAVGRLGTFYEQKDYRLTWTTVYDGMVATGLKNRMVAFPLSLLIKK